MKKLLLETIKFCDSIIAFTEISSVYRTGAESIRKQCIEAIDTKVDNVIDWEDIVSPPQPQNAGEAHDQIGMYNETFSNE